MNLKRIGECSFIKMLTLWLQNSCRRRFEVTGTVVLINCYASLLLIVGMLLAMLGTKRFVHQSWRTCFALNHRHCRQCAERFCCAWRWRLEDRSESGNRNHVLRFIKINNMKLSLYPEIRTKLRTFFQAPQKEFFSSQMHFRLSR